MSDVVPPNEAAALREEILRMVARYADIAHAAPVFDPDRASVPVSGKVYGASEITNLVDASLEFWLTTGRYNEEFEARLSAKLGARYTLTCNSGSSANLLAVTALTSHLMGSDALKPGDEVVTCATGFPTTVNPLLQNGLVPVFIDVDIPSYNIRADLIEAAITDRTRAIVIAHTLGNPFDLDTVMSLAQKYDLRVVEDCCDALGSTYAGRSVGNFGDVGTLSFYPAHHVTTGEGGAVFTNNSLLKRALESIRDWGRDCWCAPGMDNTCKQRFQWRLGGLPKGYDHKYIYSHLGYNLKMTDLQASVGVAQMDRLDGFIAIRKANFEYLYTGLQRWEEYLILPKATAKSDPSWFGFPITIRPGAPVTRGDLVAYLNQRGIATRYLFGGNLLHQPYMAGRHFRIAGDLTSSNLVMNATFWIGVYPALAKPHLDYTIDQFADFFALAGCKAS